MTAGDLIEALQGFSPTAQVIVEVNDDWVMRRVLAVDDESHWIPPDGNVYLTAAGEDDR